MKETSGELNSAVIIIGIAAAFLAFLYIIVWPSLRGNVNKNISCDKAICLSEPNDDGSVTCHMPNTNVKCSKGQSNNDCFKCAWKG